MADDGLVAHLLELLAPLGAGTGDAVRARRMFGGHGFFLGERMFGLVADDVFYLKADDRNRPRFLEAGCAPFVYVMRGAPKTMSYFEPPSDALDSADALLPWARGAVEAASAATKSPAKPASKRRGAKR